MRESKKTKEERDLAGHNGTKTSKVEKKGREGRRRSTIGREEREEFAETGIWEKRGNKLARKGKGGRQALVTAFPGYLREAYFSCERSFWG